MASETITSAVAPAPEPLARPADAPEHAAGAGEPGARPAGLELRVLTRADDARRDELVHEAPEGTVFHLAGWSRAVERVFGHGERTLGAFRGRELVGVLPLHRCKAWPGGFHLVSIPYGVYGGPAAREPEVGAALAAEAARIARAEGAGRLELRCRVDPGVPELVPSDLYAAFVRELPATSAQIWSQMPKRARAEVRKAIERHALLASEGPWYLGDLVKLFHSSKQQLGSPGLPRAWFSALLGELPRHVVLHVARASALPLAATMSFRFRDKFDFYYIGVASDANREFNATNYLVVRLQEWCVERGLKRFDLGRSRVDTGPYQFKKNQGFEPATLAYRYALVRSRSLPDFHPSNPRTLILQRAWRLLPGFVARRLSTPLMRRLP